VRGTDATAYRGELHVGRHRPVADEPLSEGGGDVGPSPFGFLLIGLAACTATALRIYAAQKARISAALPWTCATTSTSRGGHRVNAGSPSHHSADQHERRAEVVERTPVTIAIRVPIGTEVLPGSAT
jgi:putative redox protein